MIEPPGETIREKAQELGLTMAQVAHDLHLTLPRMADLLDGEMRLDESMAGRLENVLGIPARMWLAMEQEYRRPVK